MGASAVGLIRAKVVLIYLGGHPDSGDDSVLFEREGYRHDTDQVRKRHDCKVDVPLDCSLEGVTFIPANIPHGPRSPQIRNVSLTMFTEMFARYLIGNIYNLLLAKNNISRNFVVEEPLT